MRNLGEVLNRVLEEVPESEVSLRRRLRRVYESSCFTAPEEMQGRWMEAQTILAEEASGSGDWQNDIRRIWNGLEEQRVL